MKDTQVLIAGICFAIIGLVIAFALIASAFQYLVAI